MPWIDAEGGFRLTRYFSMTALLVFLVVGAVLYYLEREESAYFRAVQENHGRFVEQVQQQFAVQQELTARRELLSIHEAGHVNLTRLMANALWSTHIAPLAARAQAISVEPCRTPAQACVADLGRRIMALPEFAQVDATLGRVMRGSTVFKIKVFDLRGVTVYSSEKAQVGEDKRNNQGWRSAVAGQAASELTHRDRFSAFEGVVENRDLISSYVPVRAPDDGKILGVFEIYSDVTPFLRQIQNTAKATAELAAANQIKLAYAAEQSQKKVDASSDVLLAVVGALLAALYCALLFLVLRAQRIIDAEAHARAALARRDARWHREKMSALAAMAANVSHEIGNPLATISAVAEDIASRQKAGEIRDAHADVILEQVKRIAARTRQVSDFAAARSETLEPVDVNQMVRAVCDFLGFDRRFRDVPIVFHAGAGFAAPVIIPDHLTEALMGLLEALVEPGGTQLTGIQVETDGGDDGVRIGISWSGGAAAANDPRIDAVRDRVVGMGGRIVNGERSVEIVLPVPVPVGR